MASTSRKTLGATLAACLIAVTVVVAPVLAKRSDRPESHQVEWLSRHQAAAKQDPTECQQCHTNQMFCIDCHQRRDTVQERVHRRNFRIFHSIQARANPRRCEACHTVQYCQECHSGRGTSKR